MRFLCFPGAGSNAQTFKPILAPFMAEMESDNSMSFTFTQGEVPCQIPEKFLAHYGPEPHLQFIARKGTFRHACGDHTMYRLPEIGIVLTKGDRTILRTEYFQDLTARFAAVERAIDNATPEEKMRLSLQNLQPLDGSVDAALAKVFRLIDQEGPFDGVIGHSEGTAMAATVLLEERRRFRETGRPQQLKCAILFNGFPPLIPGKNRYLLADEGRGTLGYEDWFINVPTLHVLGSLDPWVYGSLALYNVCCNDKAILFDHGGGHSVPRDARTIRELGQIVREMIGGLK